MQKETQCGFKFSLPSGVLSKFQETPSERWCINNNNILLSIFVFRGECTVDERNTETPLWHQVHIEFHILILLVFKFSGFKLLEATLQHSPQST